MTAEASSFSPLKTLFTLGNECGFRRGRLAALTSLGILASFFSNISVQAMGAIVNAMSGSQAEDSVFECIEYIRLAFGGVQENPTISRISTFALAYLALYLLYTVTRNVFAFYIMVYSEKLVLFIRQKCFTSILHARREALLPFSSGDLVHRVMTDSGQVHFLFYTPALHVISDMVDLVWISIFLLIFDWRVFLILAAVVPLLLYFNARAGRVQRSYAEKTQAISGECTTSVHRMLEGLDNIKASVGEALETMRFREQNDRLFIKRKAADKALSFFFPLEGMLRATGTITAVSFTAWLAFTDAAALGAVPVVFIYAQRFYAPMNNWVRYYQVVQKGIVSLQRLKTVMDLEQEKEEVGTEGPLFPFGIYGGVQLPAGKRADISLYAETPGLLLMRGRSGAGKTQLLRSLLRLGATFEGEIILGGEKKNSPPSLRKHAAYAAQGGHFIEGTIAGNIGYPLPLENIDRERCRNLLDAVNLSSVSVDAHVREFGSNFSLGEQRRLILCRALYTNRPILLLDEIDANVDAKTRSDIYRVIEKEREKRLIILVSHAHESELSSFDPEWSCVVGA